MGRGGKSLLGEPAFKGFLEGQLVAFDREQVFAALVVENRPRGVRLGVERVGQHEFARQIQLLQQPARGRDFVALRGRYDAAQKPARRVYGVDGFHAGVPDFLPSTMTIRSCVGPQTCSCHRRSTRSSASSATAVRTRSKVVLPGQRRAPLWRSACNRSAPNWPCLSVAA